jgi:DNA N-6-adenine-methyltransferase (Dam)
MNKGIGDFAISKGIGGHHRGYAGGSVIWLTPPVQILAKLGKFDLDPCAAPLPRPWDTATTHYESDGLDREWFGRVWLNPPYGPELGKWLKRLAQHGNGIAIAFARTETKAFFDWIWPMASGLLFIQGRLNFHRQDGIRAKANAGGPSVLIAYGNANAEALRISSIPGQFIDLAACRGAEMRPCL